MQVHYIVISYPDGASDQAARRMNTHSLALDAVAACTMHVQSVMPFLGSSRTDSGLDWTMAFELAWIVHIDATSVTRFACSSAAGR